MIQMIIPIKNKDEIFNIIKRSFSGDWEPDWKDVYKAYTEDYNDFVKKVDEAFEYYGRYCGGKFAKFNDDDYITVFQALNKKMKEEEEEEKLLKEKEEKEEREELKRLIKKYGVNA